MNLQSLVVVILRLMALNFLLQVAIQLTPHALLLFQVFGPNAPGGSRSGAILPLLAVNTLLVAAILVWHYALPIARFVTGGVSHDLSLGALSLADCYSIAFMGIGLFYIAGEIATVLNIVFYIFKAAASTSGTAWRQGINFSELSLSLIPFIVGVALFVNSRRWAIALARRQTGLPASTTTSTATPHE